MTRSCAAFGCSQKFKKGSNISFHPFPLSKPDLLKKWVIAVRRYNFEPSRFHSICSQHFRENDYMKGYVNVRRLKPDAVPSIFPAFSKQFQKNNQRSSRKRRKVLLEEPNLGEILKEESHAEFAISCNSRPNIPATSSKHLNVAAINNKHPASVSSTSSECPNVLSNSKGHLSVPSTSVLSTSSETPNVPSTGSEPPNVPAASSESPNVLTASCKNLNVPAIIVAHADVPAAKCQDPATSSEHSYSQSDPTFTKLKHGYEEQLIILRKKLKTSQRKVQRQRKYLENLKEKYRELKKKDLLNENAVNLINSYFDGPSAELLHRLVGGNKGEYSDALKSFALTLHFYSPRAYEYIREKFSSCLPHPSTLKKWCASTNDSQDFIESPFKIVENSAMLEEMPISKDVEWNETKFMEYIHFETSVESNNA